MQATTARTLSRASPLPKKINILLILKGIISEFCGPCGPNCGRSGAPAGAAPIGNRDSLQHRGGTTGVGAAPVPRWAAKRPQKPIRNKASAPGKLSPCSLRDSAAPRRRADSHRGQCRRPRSMGLHHQASQCRLPRCMGLHHPSRSVQAAKKQERAPPCGSGLARDCDGGVAARWAGMTPACQSSITAWQPPPQSHFTPRIHPISRPGITLARPPSFLSTSSLDDGLLAWQKPKTRKNPAPRRASSS